MTKITGFEELLKKKIAITFGIGQEEIKKFSFSSPPAHLNCDVSISWPISAAKFLKKPPIEIAEKIASLLTGEFAVNASVLPPGFVNVEFPCEFLANSAKEMISTQDYFVDAKNKAEKVNIEFVSANPTGPLHLASGRAATLGDSLARIMKFLGYDVSTEYYVNDAGRQVELLGLSLKARYSAAEPPENGYKGEYLKEIAAKIPSGSEISDAGFSKLAVDEILQQHKKALRDFGVKFDRWFFESELLSGDKLNKALELLKSRGMVLEKDGAVWFGSSCEQADADDKDRVLVKSGGKPTYFLSDIAYHMDKFDRGFTRLIDIWGADHHGYVPRMKSAIQAIGKKNESFTVIIHQLVYLKRGEQIVKMSKREGEFVTLKELLDEAGKDACRFFFATRSPNTHFNFDIDLAKKQSQENPVYYVQYVHARICSIFRNAAGAGRHCPQSVPRALGAAEKNISAEKTDFPEVALNPEERKILAKLIWFEKILKNCVQELSPHSLTSYLAELAGLFHSFYDKHKVLDATDMETTEFRIFLLKGVKFVISKGLDLLGVSAPEKM
ncbi:MAG: arginine--tRNA ligase [Elusimicrobia bacterium]|nr:arginine--tRNA ligase [Elusimicrobiota bacterium]